ncbi:hypothetical protein [Nonomuraea sediminis]|uniref:hypothetical protein n=1 Tax=Nonomuraea sediminis TaxID=2835864 RepID=UPI001BDC750F|nr:hypothetical protein [Nonomuraea sediminis]
MSDELSGEERAELERLRGEMAALRERRAKGRWRAWVSAVLITLGCVLLPVSGVAYWAANQVADTARYVENVTPLASDPTVQAAATDRVTAAVMKALDVPSLVKRLGGALPPKIGEKVDGLSGAINGGVQGFVRDAVGKVVASDQFQSVWVDANRVAHTQLNAVLSGQGSAVLKVTGNTVSVDLGPIIDKVKQKLVASGLGIAASIPELHPTFELFQSPDLVRWQTLYSWLLALQWALPILTLILLALGIYIARNHRRAVLGTGVGIAVGMLVLAAGLLLVRAAYLNSAAAHGLNTAAAATVYDTLVRFLRQGLRTILVLGVVIAVGAFFTGPSTTAVATRRFLSGHIGGKVNTGRFGLWLYRYRGPVRAGVVAVAALVFVFWDHPTGKVVLLLAVLTLLVLGLVELLSRKPPEPMESTL